jgi:hypothetical protein
VAKNTSQYSSIQIFQSFEIQRSFKHINRLALNIQNNVPLLALKIIFKVPLKNVGKIHNQG